MFSLSCSSQLSKISLWYPRQVLCFCKHTCSTAICIHEPYCNVGFKDFRFGLCYSDCRSVYQYWSCFPYSLVSRQRHLHKMKNWPNFFRYWQLVVTKTIRYWRSVKFLSIAPLPLHFSWTYSYVYGYYRSMSPLYKLGIILWLHFNGIQRLLFTLFLSSSIGTFCSLFCILYTWLYCNQIQHWGLWNHGRKLFKDIISSCASD